MKLFIKKRTQPKPVKLVIEANKTPYPIIPKDKLLEILTNTNSPHGLYNTFCLRYRELAHGSSIAALHKYIQFIHDFLFNEPTPKDTTYHMIQLRISYYLLWLGHKYCKKELSDRVHINLEASWKYDITKMTPTMRTLVEILERQERKEEGTATPKNLRQHHIVKETKKLEVKKMGLILKLKRKIPEEKEVPAVLKNPAPKKEKVSVPKREKKQKKHFPVITAGKRSHGIGNFCCKMFKRNSRERLTDGKLAKLIKQEFPENKAMYDSAYIHRQRGLYNRGMFPCQEEVKPRSQSIAY